MKTRKLLIAVFSAVFLLTGFTSLVYAAGEPVGIIISMYNGAWVERDGGAKESLTLKTPIYRGDTISTDRTGKAQILFNDDTTVAVAPKSTINIDDFVFNESKKSYFSVKVVEGASRVISGKIVEQNPIGFKMSAPHGTAGIRGTIVSVVVGPKDDIFAVESIGPNHFVDISQNTNIFNTTRSTTEGYSIIVNDNPAVTNMQRRTTDEERNLMNDVFSSRPVPVAENNKSATGEETETAATATDTKTAAKDKKEEGKKDDAKKDDKGSGAVAGDVKSDSVANQGKTEAIVDNKNNPGVADNTIKDTAKDTDVSQKENVELPQTFVAFYNGNLNATRNAPGANTGYEGKFGFKVDVGRGTYSEGYMNGQAKGEGVFNLSNGTGTVNRNGAFTASGFRASGTGTYATASGGSMTGSITTDGATVGNWLVYNSGNIELIGGNGTGWKSDALNNRPYNDLKASYQGTLASALVIQPSGLAPEQKFGFNLFLTSGVINDAFMYYVGDEGTMKAVNGSGKAAASDANSFGAFTISGFTVTGYDLYNSFTGGNASLKGEMLNNDNNVQITGGNIGTYNFTGGVGEKVANLPDINPSRRGTYTSFQRNNADPAQATNYYAYGFKVELLTANLSEIYMYGGQIYNDGAVGNDPFQVDVTGFLANNESGKINANGSVNIQMKNAQFNKARYMKEQKFALVGNFAPGYTGFNGGIQYDGKVTTWPGAADAVKNGEWRPLPFMTAYYEGGTKIGNTSVSTGFKLNLVSGSLTQAYLLITEPAVLNKLQAFDGLGNYNMDTGLFSYKWDQTNPASPKLVGSGRFANVANVTVDGGFAQDYSQAGARVMVTDGTDILFDTGSQFSLPKMGALTPTMAYYEGVLPISAVSLGGKMGFSVNLFDGTIKDAGFYFKESRTITTIGHNGKGTLTNGILDIAWLFGSGELTTVGDPTTNVRYNTAQLEGALIGSTLKVNSGVTGNDIVINDRNIQFNVPVDYTSEKKGTVSGTLTGGTIQSGTYAFNANLYSGVIDNAKIDVKYGSGVSNFRNGIGTISAGAFAIGNYSGGGSGAFVTANNATMTGTVNGQRFENINWTLINSLGGGGVIASGRGSDGVIGKP